MGVNSVDGLDHTVLTRAYAAPAPQLRTAEATSGGAPLARTTGKPKEEQVQQANIPARKASEPIPEQTTRIRVDKATKRIVTQIIGKDNEVIRQIPQQELLDISARAEQLQGLLFDQRA